MRKYAVMLLAVMLVGVMASGAWAWLEVVNNIKVENCYVGGKSRTLAIIHPMNYGATYSRFSYSWSGAMPPGCHLEVDDEYDGIMAEIIGIPTMAGIYTITVRVHGRGTSQGRLLTDDGSITFTLTIRPPEGNDDDIGGNTSKDTPAPVPDPSKDIPAPVPDPKLEALKAIAETLGTTSDSVSYISSSDMSAPQAPTSRITNALAALSLDIISTQGSLNISQSGYYAFPLTVPASLVGTNTKLTVYVADRDEFGSASFSPSAVTSPLIPAAIFTEAGGKVTTLPKTIIAAANLGAKTARTFSTHIAKAKTKTDDDDDSKGVSSSGGGGCSSFPAVLALALTALITLRKSRR